VTPEQWLERASHTDAEALQAASEGRVGDAVTLSVQAQRYREVAEEMRRALTGKERQRSISGMRVAPQVVAKVPESVKRGRARARRTSAAQELLYAAGWAITDLAAHLGEQRSTVSAWFGTGDHARPVPLRHAEALERGVATGAKDKDGKPVMLRIPRTNWAKLGR
jgi:hypothetical protein